MREHEQWVNVIVHYGVFTLNAYSRGVQPAALWPVSWCSYVITRSLT